MQTKLSPIIRKICCRLFAITMIIGGTISPAFAQSATATIVSLKGTVSVMLQGENELPASVDTVLSQGDSIQTEEGAMVVLKLSDDSTLQLGANTHLEIAVLLQDTQTQARTSRIKLLWGKMRAFLSPGHQKADSSFTVEPPNALVGVKFSHPYVETGYNPKTGKSRIAAHTVKVAVTNTETGESEEIEEGYEVVIEETIIEVSEMLEDTVTIFDDLLPLMEEDLPEFFEEMPEIFQEELLVLEEELEELELFDLQDEFLEIGEGLSGEEEAEDEVGEEAEDEVGEEAEDEVGEEEEDEVGEEEED
jgi:ferric-dicitrate binding protein FerR (iron transport regulator)